MFEWIGSAYTSIANATNAVVDRVRGGFNALTSERDPSPDRPVPEGEKIKTSMRIPLFLPYWDQQQSVGETELMRLAYRRMLADPHVKSALLGKIFAVMGEEINIRPHNKVNVRDQLIASFNEWNIKERLKGGFAGLVWSVLIGGLLDGYSVCEKVWDVEEEGAWKGKEVLTDLKPKDVNQDLVVEVDEYRNILYLKGLRFNSGQEFNPDDFVVFTYLPLYGTPTGMSDMRACYDDQTQVLTKAGWKLFRDLTDEDEMACLDRDHGAETLFYAKPTDKIAYHYSGQMFRQNSYHVDLCVTPNHRMFVAKHNGGGTHAHGEFDFVNAENLMDGSFPKIYRYKRNAAWNGEEVATFTLPEVEWRQQTANQFGKYGDQVRRQDAKTMPMDEWLRFLGIYLAEGSCYRRKDGNRQCSVCITQNPGDTLEEIIEVVQRLGFSYCVEPARQNKSSCTVKISSLQLYTYVQKLGKSHTKYVPQEFKALSSRQLAILLEWMMKGDGRHNGKDYCTVSTKLADDVSEIVLKCGFAPTVRREKTKAGGIWIVGVNSKGIDATEVNRITDTRSWEEYDGMVYCVTVPGSLLYVRRNGKSAWCGNCYSSYWFMDTVKKLRAMGAEKRALPVVAAEYPDPSKQAQVESSLAQLKSNNWIAIPKDVKLQVLEIAGSSEEYFKSFRADLVEEIFLALQGATLQALAGQSGVNVGRSTTHKETSDLFKWVLSNYIVGILNDHKTGLIRDITTRNFVGVSAWPKASLGGIDQDAMTKDLQIDEGLQRMGFVHDRDDICERYNRKFGTGPNILQQPGMGGGMMGGDMGGAAMPGAEGEAGGGDNVDDMFSPDNDPFTGGGIDEGTEETTAEGYAEVSS